MDKPLINQNLDISPYRFVIEAIIFFTYLAFGLTWSAAGVFLPDLMKELSLTLSQASFTNTSVTLAKFAGPLATGFVLQKLGLKKSFTLASFLICLGILAPLSHSYELILAARFTMGIGGALVVVLFTPLVMEWFPANEKVIANGLNYIALSIGMMLGLAFTDSLMNYFEGSWKMVLVTYSSLSIIMFITWLLGGREGPLECQKCSAERKVESGSEKASFFQALKNINTWKLTLSYSGVLSLYMVLITYFPTFYKTRGWSQINPLFLKAPALVMITSVPTIAIAIWFAHKIQLRKPLLKIAGLAIVPGVFGMFLYRDLTVVFIGAILTGIGMFFWRPALFTIPQELPGVNTRDAGHIMGIFWAVSYAVSTLNVWLVGRITELTGSFIPGFTFIAIFSSSMLMGAYLLPETGPGKFDSE